MMRTRSTTHKSIPSNKSKNEIKAYLASPLQLSDKNDDQTSKIDSAVNIKTQANFQEHSSMQFIIR